MNLNPSNMVNSIGDKMLARMFQPVKDVVWDISTGKMGILGKNNSIYSIQGDGENAQVVENMFSEFGVAVPAFAQSVPFDDVQLGDLAFRPGGRPGWVVEKNPNSLILLNTDSSEGTLRRNKVVTMGMDQSGVMVLRNLFSLTGAGGQANFQMMLPMLMAGSTNEDAGDMVQMMLMMSVMGQGTPGAEVAASAPVEVPPQPKLVQEDIPADATKATIVEITKRNNEALVAYQAAVDAWAKVVATLASTKPAVAAPVANPMQSMMPMLMLGMMNKGKGGKDFFGKN